MKHVKLFEQFLSEANSTLSTKSMFDHGGMIKEAASIPSNIASWAKNRGILPDVKQIARWAEKAGKRIVGGTAIGKGYDTLILDLTHQGAEIYFDTYKGTIRVNNQPVTDWKSFSKAVNEGKNLNEASNEEVNPKIKDGVISRLSDFFRVSPNALKKFSFDGNDNIKELTKALNSTSDQGTKLYYDTAIKLAKKDLGIYESITS